MSTNPVRNHGLVSFRKTPHFYEDKHRVFFWYLVITEVPSQHENKEWLTTVNQCMKRYLGNNKLCPRTFANALESVADIISERLPISEKERILESAIKRMQNITSINVAIPSASWEQHTHQSRDAMAKSNKVLTLRE